MFKRYSLFVSKSQGFPPVVCIHLHTFLMDIFLNCTEFLLWLRGLRT